jgi:hypothetical protein
MKFDLTAPCDSCPFRTDKLFRGLGIARKQEIADALTRRQQTFACHKTIDYSGDESRYNDNTQHCAGAMILLEKLGRPNQMMRWMERIGYYDRHRLNMEAPVVDSFKEWFELEAGASDESD